VKKIQLSENGATEVITPQIEEVEIPLEPVIPAKYAAKGEVGIVVGAPGVGKTWFVASFPNVLVLELDPEGLRYIDWPVAYMQVDTVAKLRGAITQLVRKRDEIPYETIAIDSLTQLEQMLQEEVTKDLGVPFNRVPHGQGWVEVRKRLIKIIMALRKTEKRVIVTAHNTKLLFESGEAMVGLELSGKAKNLVAAAVDWIAWLHIDGDGNRVLDFRHDDTLEFKSRNPNLAGKVIPADVNVFLKTAYGEGGNANQSGDQAG